MKVKIFNNIIQGVIGGKVFWHVYIDMEMWESIFKDHKSTDIPDWWLVGQVTEKSSIITQTPAATGGGEKWMIIATENPSWWLAQVKKDIKFDVIK